MPKKQTRKYKHKRLRRKTHKNNRAGGFSFDAAKVHPASLTF